MPTQGTLFPAWNPPAQDRFNAVHRHLKRATHVIVHSGMYSAEMTVSFMNEQFITALRRALLFPNLHWTRHTRKSREKNKPNRTVYSPHPHLRALQQLTVDGIFPATPRGVATAFHQGDDIVRNAKVHRGNRCCFRIDITSAFPSVTTRHIASFLVRNGVDKDVAWVMARLWTCRGKLEQGAPVAPMIFNAMLERLDRDLCQAVGAPFEVDDASEPGPRVTRYGDDIVVTLPQDRFPARLASTIIAIVEAHGFRVNHKKTRWGQNGVFTLPGVKVDHGRVTPNNAYVQRVINGGSAMPMPQRIGHRAYLSQYGHAGDLPKLRAILGPRSQKKLKIRTFICEDIEF